MMWFWVGMALCAVAGVTADGWTDLLAVIMGQIGIVCINQES